MASVPVDLLFGKVASILETEVLLIGGVRDELDELKKELTSMQSFLKDAYTMTDLSEVEKARVAEVRNMCYPVEDIMEEFIYHMNKPYPEEGGKFLKPLYQMIRIPKNLWVKHRVATKLQVINKKIKSIPERGQRYRFDSHVEGTGSRGGDDDAQRRRLQNLSEALVFAKDDHFVGIEDDTRQLVKWLTQEELGLTAISVVGMGGSGKTTLVSKVYNTHEVKQHFQCYAWITVSERYVVEDLLKRMIKEFYSSCKENNNVPADLSSKEFRELLEILRDYLRPKRYVVVFDDVWTDKLWREIEFALPDEGLGSRVILTTRNEQVASSFLVRKSYVHHVKPLEPSEAWNLFCSNAFSTNPNKSCPKELQAVARQLVAKCGGLPLAILALGGLMHSRKLVDDWIAINLELNQVLSKEDLVKSILLRSFIDLPFQHKCCFLYCCIFPEDYFIKRKRVIRLLMAEGFVADHHQQGATRTPEQVADGYLMELVHRNMLQVVRRNHVGRPKVLKMHDLMRELGLSKSKEENLCTVYDGREASEEEISRARRLSIQLSATEELVMPANHCMSQIRSLFVFIAGRKRPFDYTLPSSFRLLRVLDLEDIPFTNLPDNIVDLFNLRYLNLESTLVKELPKSIGRLSNLQTLRIRATGIEVLPTGITKLLKLRHLSMGGAQWPVPSSISKLNNLQVLDCVEAEPALLKQLEGMTQLTRIGITNLREAHEENLRISIERMNLLRQLFLKVANEEYLRINAFPRAPLYLRKMVLEGKLDGVPDWFGSLPNLLSLHLIGSKLSEDLITRLQALPKLAELVLNDACEGNRLCFSAGFSKLKDLRFENLPQLNVVIIHEGVMPGLLKLSFEGCTQLEGLISNSVPVRNLYLQWLLRQQLQLVPELHGQEWQEQRRQLLQELQGQLQEWQGQLLPQLPPEELLLPQLPQLPPEELEELLLLLPPRQQQLQRLLQRLQLMLPPRQQMMRLWRQQQQLQLLPRLWRQQQQLAAAAAASSPWSCSCSCSRQPLKSSCSGGVKEGEGCCRISRVRAATATAK